jgi:hypothetical protein
MFLPPPDNPVRAVGQQHLSHHGRTVATQGVADALVGIEVLDAKEVLGSGKVPAVVLEGSAASVAPLAVREKPAKKCGQ